MTFSSCPEQMLNTKTSPLSMQFTGFLFLRLGTRTESSRRNVGVCGCPSLREYLENEKTDNNRLHEKEDGVEFMITLIACDCSSKQSREIENAASKVCRS